MARPRTYRTDERRQLVKIARISGVGVGGENNITTNTIPIHPQRMTRGSRSESPHRQNWGEPKWTIAAKSPSERAGIRPAERTIRQPTDIANVNRRSNLAVRTTRRAECMRSAKRPRTDDLVASANAKGQTTAQAVRPERSTNNSRQSSPKASCSIPLPDSNLTDQKRDLHQNMEHRQLKVHVTHQRVVPKKSRPNEQHSKRTSTQCGDNNSSPTRS